MPKVSVVIPTYNNALYIVEAVESVLNQTFKDFEIIVVDDGSKDNTKEVLKPYIDKDLIRYKYQDNQGPGVARNTGILSAKGDYIAFLDSDDTLTKDSLERRLSLIESEPDLGLVFSDNFGQLKGSEKVELYRRIFSKYISRFMVRTSKGIIFNGPIKDTSEVAFYIHTITVLVKKQVFQEVGLFRTDIIRAEDTDMWLRIATKYKIGYIDSPLAQYNHFRGHLTTAEPLHYCLGRINFYGYLLKSHHNEKRICRGLNERMALAYYDLGSYYSEHNLRIKFIINFIKSFYYKPFGLTYRHKYFIFYFVPERFKYILKKLRKYLSRAVQEN